MPAQKNILIIDYTAQHPEVVKALVAIFRQHRVQLAVTEQFFNKFLTQESSPVFTHALVKSADHSTRHWFKRLAPLMAGQDIVICSTPIKDRLLRQTLSLETGGCKILFVHNVNYYLEFKAADFQTFARLQGDGRLIVHQLSAYLWKLVKHWGKQWWLWRQHANFAHLNRHVDFYCFTNNKVEGYFREKSGMRNTLMLPYNACKRTAMEPVECPPYRDRLNIAIIGNVSQLRKEYLQVITALRKASLQRPVRLSLLGRCPDPSFAKKLAGVIHENTNPNLEICFNPAQAYIPTAELIGLLNDVHCLLSPIQPDILYQLYHEIYGVSKVSGSEGDCLAYTRPSLMPQSYRCADYIEPMVVQYTDMDNLISVINELNDGAALAALYYRFHSAMKKSDDDKSCENFLQAATASGCTFK